MLAHELLEIFDDDAIGQRAGVEILAGDLHQQALAGVVVEAVGAVALVREQLLHGDVAVDAEVAPARPGSTSAVSALWRTKLPSSSGVRGVCRKRRSLPEKRP